VFWSNLGLKHAKEQSGRLASAVLTAVLCVLWTIPVTFVAGISQPQELKKLLPFLADWTAAWPPLESALKLLAPLALVVLFAVLPMILTMFAKLEGHISTGKVQASLFSKLTAFTIIQVFFVSAIAGSLFGSIAELAADPIGTLQSVLSENLPSQYPCTLFLYLGGCCVDCYLLVLLNMLHCVARFIF
jgi:hypothetical protein